MNASEESRRPEAFRQLTTGDAALSRSRAAREGSGHQMAARRHRYAEALTNARITDDVRWMRSNELARASRSPRYNEM